MTHNKAALIIAITALVVLILILILTKPNPRVSAKATGSPKPTPVRRKLAGGGHANHSADINKKVSPTAPWRRIIEQEKSEITLARFFFALRMHESKNGKELIGDDGDSLGLYHISEPFWQDACEYGRVDWDYETDVYSREKSEQVIIWYWLQYCPEAWIDRDWEVLARTHNGGPNGAAKESTEMHWLAVRLILENYSIKPLEALTPSVPVGPVCVSVAPKKIVCNTESEWD